MIILVMDLLFLKIVNVSKVRYTMTMEFLGKLVTLINAINMNVMKIITFLLYSKVNLIPVNPMELATLSNKERIKNMLELLPHPQILKDFVKLKQDIVKIIVLRMDTV